MTLLEQLRTSENSSIIDVIESVIRPFSDAYSPSFWSAHDSSMVIWKFSSENEEKSLTLGDIRAAYDLLNQTI